MNKKGIFSIVVILLIAAVLTSGLLRAAIELAIFSILLGYVVIMKKNKKG